MIPWALVIFLALLPAAIVESKSHELGLGNLEVSALRVLDDRTFEHDTQAATGQTAGLWLVLFTESESHTCKDAESALLQVASHLNGDQPVIAKVNTSASTKTAKRFDLQELPSLILFRDRHMFKYGGKWSAVEMIDFIEDGWNGVPLEDVPKEIVLGDELQEKFLAIFQVILNWLGNRPGILACLGAVSATGAYLYTKQLLTKKRKQRSPRGRPRKRSD